MLYNTEKNYVKMHKDIEEKDIIFKEFNLVQQPPQGHKYNMS